MIGIIKLFSHKIFGMQFQRQIQFFHDFGVAGRPNTEPLQYFEIDFELMQMGRSHA